MTPHEALATTMLGMACIGAVATLAAAIHDALDHLVRRYLDARRRP